MTTQSARRSDEWWVAAEARGVQRCSAQSKHGDGQCRKTAIRGGTVCATHGGRARQVKAKADQRLLDMVLPAMAQLRRIIESGQASDADKLRAVQLVLNRTGYSEKTEVGVVVELKPYGAILDKILVEVDDVVDAEVIENDDEEARLLAMADGDSPGLAEPAELLQLEPAAPTYSIEPPSQPEVNLSSARPRWMRDREHRRR